MIHRCNCCHRPPRQNFPRHLRNSHLLRLIPRHHYCCNRHNHHHPVPANRQKKNWCMQCIGLWHHLRSVCHPARCPRMNLVREPHCPRSIHRLHHRSVNLRCCIRQYHPHRHHRQLPSGQQGCKAFCEYRLHHRHRHRPMDLYHPSRGRSEERRVG